MPDFFCLITAYRTCSKNESVLYLTSCCDEYNQIDKRSYCYDKKGVAFNARSVCTVTETRDDLYRMKSVGYNSTKCQYLDALVFLMLLPILFNVCCTFYYWY